MNGPHALIIGTIVLIGARGDPALDQRLLPGLLLALAAAVLLASWRALRVRTVSQVTGQATGQATGQVRGTRDLAQVASLLVQVPAFYLVWLAFGQDVGPAALALPPLVWSLLTPLPGTGRNIPLRLVLLLFGPYSPLEQVTPNTRASG